MEKVNILKLSILQKKNIHVYFFIAAASEPKHPKLN